MKQSWSSLAPLPLRLIFGGWLAYHGSLKLFTEQGHQNVIQMLQQVHVPAPEIVVWYVGASEFLGGLCLFFGLFVPLAAGLNVLNLLGNMFNTWRYGPPTPLQDCSPDWVCEPFPGYEVSMLYIGAFLALILGGRSLLSLGRAFGAGGRDDDGRSHEMRSVSALTVTGIAFFLFGLTLLAAPTTFANLYGASLTGFGTQAARLWGAANLGLGLMALRAAGPNETRAQRAVILGLIVVNAAYTVIYLWLTLSGQVNLLGWASVLAHPALAGLLLFRLAVGPSPRC